MTPGENPKHEKVKGVALKLMFLKKTVSNSMSSVAFGLARQPVGNSLFSLGEDIIFPAG